MTINCCCGLADLWQASVSNGKAVDDEAIEIRKE